MNKLRLLSLPAIAAATVLALAGCFGTPTPTATTGGSTGTDSSGTDSSIELAGTSWSGTDSVGDFTVFDFEADGTVNVTYNDQQFDEATDTWELDGSALTVVVFLNDDLGDVVYTGEVTGDTIDLEGVIEGDTPFTITLTKG